MSNLGLNSEEEYNQLKSMYQSEGFGIYLRLLDSLIGQKYNKIMDDKTGGEEVIKLVNQVKGVTSSKEVCFNILKEAEVNYKG